METHHAVCDCKYIHHSAWYVQWQRFLRELNFAICSKAEKFAKYSAVVNSNNEVVNCAINFTPLHSRMTGARPLSFNGSLNHRTMRTQNYSKWSRHGRNKHFLYRTKTNDYFLFSGNLIPGLSRVLCSLAFEWILLLTYVNSFTIKIPLHLFFFWRSYQGPRVVSTTLTRTWLNLASYQPKKHFAE